MHRLVTILAPLLGTLLASLAVAQAPSTPSPMAPDLAFTLLGTANSIAIDVPEVARHLYVAAVQHGEVILLTDRALTERPDGSLTTRVAAGAMAGANACPVLLFVHTSLEAERGQFSSGTRSYCLDQAAGPVRRAPIPAPLVGLPSPRELRLDTWVALEAVRLNGEPPFDGDDLSSLVIFYLRLSTAGADQPPAPPTFTTVEELVREQIGRPAD